MTSSLSLYCCRACERESKLAYAKAGGSADDYEAAMVAGAIAKGADTMGSCVDTELKKVGITDFDAAKPRDTQRAFRACEQQAKAAFEKAGGPSTRRPSSSGFPQFHSTCMRVPQVVGAPHRVLGHPCLHGYGPLMACFVCVQHDNVIVYTKSFYKLLLFQRTLVLSPCHRLDRGLRGGPGRGCHG